MSRRGFLGGLLALVGAWLLPGRPDKFAGAANFVSHPASPEDQVLSYDVAFNDLRLADFDVEVRFT